jgi:hypothetical protein
MVDFFKVSSQTKKGGAIMPFGDRTGPLGQGSRTGRGWGFCHGFAVPWSSFGRGRPWGFGRGRRFKFGNQGFEWGFGGVTPVEPSELKEAQRLEQEAKGLERALRGVRSRIERLKSKFQTQGVEEDLQKSMKASP